MNDHGPGFESATDVLVHVQHRTWETVRQLPDEYQNPVLVALVLAADALSAANYAAGEHETLRVGDEDRAKMDALWRQVADLAGLRADDTSTPPTIALGDETYRPTAEEIEEMPLLVLWKEEDGDRFLAIRNAGERMRVEIGDSDGARSLGEGSPDVDGLARWILDRISRDLYLGRLALQGEWRSPVRGLVDVKTRG